LRLVARAIYAREVKTEMTTMEVDPFPNQTAKEEAPAGEWGWTAAEVPSKGCAFIRTLGSWRIATAYS